MAKNVTVELVQWAAPVVLPAVHSCPWPRRLARRWATVVPVVEPFHQHHQEEPQTALSATLVLPPGAEESTNVLQVS